MFWRNRQSVKIQAGGNLTTGPITQIQTIIRTRPQLTEAQRGFIFLELLVIVGLTYHLTGSTPKAFGVFFTLFLVARVYLIWMVLTLAISICYSIIAYFLVDMFTALSSPRVLSLNMEAAALALVAFALAFQLHRAVAGAR